MLFSDSYFTVVKPAEGLFKDRGSKFMGFVFPVRSESEIKAQLAALRKQHPSANHHCYAWRLGADKAAFRANDDGEPSNSAGKPILAQIQSRDLTNVLVVVVRYFGGTLLGVSGLINAYKHAAAEALNNAAIEEQFIMFEYSVSFGFDDLSAVMRILKENDASITGTAYDEQNTITFRVKKHYSERLEEKFRGLYAAKLQFMHLI